MSPCPVGRNNSPRLIIWAMRGSNSEEENVYNYVHQLLGHYVLSYALVFSLDQTRQHQWSPARTTWRSISREANRLWISPGAPPTLQMIQVWYRSLLTWILVCGPLGTITSSWRLLTLQETRPSAPLTSWLKVWTLGRSLLVEQKVDYVRSTYSTKYSSVF